MVLGLIKYGPRRLRGVDNDDYDEDDDDDDDDDDNDEDHGAKRAHFLRIGGQVV